MWPFRPPQTPPDASQRHTTVLDLIEQVAALRGRLGALEVEWGDVKESVKKAYQRVERANQRADRRIEDREGEPEAAAASSVDPHPDGGPLHGFVKKLQEMKGA